MIHIGRAGAKLGAFSEEEVRQGLARGRFLPGDLGWKEGMEKWEPLSQFTELSEPPPLPVEMEEEPPPPAEPATPPGLPWDERAQKGWLGSFTHTAWLVMTNPAAAFARMRTVGGLPGAMLFSLIGGWFALVLSAAYMVLYSKMGGEVSAPTAIQKAFSADRAVTALESMLLMGPVIVTVLVLVLAGIGHLFLMLTGGAKKTFDVTLRVFCYSFGASELLQVFPMCGGVVAAVWMVVCCMVGLAVAHRTTMGRSVTAMVLFIVVCFLAYLGLFALVAGTALQ